MKLPEENQKEAMEFGDAVAALLPGRQMAPTMIALMSMAVSAAFLLHVPKEVFFRQIERMWKSRLQ
jgi:hypothetical protein